MNTLHPPEPPKLLLLDVYETLLDMAEVQRYVNEILNSKRGYPLWHELFMEYCFVDNCIDQFNPFTAIAKATMQMAAKILGVKVTEHQVDSALSLLKHAPLHPGTQEGLSALNDTGIRIAALTNAPEAIVRDRMERTGLISYFEEVLSAEHVGKYKPSAAVYRWAAQRLQLDCAQIAMVTAHGWDLAGAANAGLRTVQLNSGPQVMYPLAPQPDWVCDSLEALVPMLQRSH